MKQNIHEPVIGIGTLAKRVGLSVSAIRKYEDEGLIIAHRTESGHRLFSFEDVIRIGIIQFLLRTLGFNIEGIRRMQALLPCWDLLPCKDCERDACYAYSNSSHPCWLVKDALCSLQGNECRECIVYRFGSLCTEDIKELLHHHNEGNNIKKVMYEILERKLAV
jgi:MerR family transcriptional regulator/heat shock protein HspR